MASNRQSKHSSHSLRSPHTPTRKIKFNFAHFRKFLGPGLLVSIAYMDPGSLSGDLDAGTFGQTKLLWLLLCSTAYGLVFQTISSRVGTVTGCDLSTICSRSFKKHISLILWISCEIAIIGSDIQEVIGSSVAFNLLFGIPIWSGALITIVDTFIILFTTVFGMQKLEYIFAVLVGCIFVCFFTNLVLIKPNVPQILLGCVYPRIPSSALTQAVALIGSNLTPHNMYLHSALVQTRDIDHTNKFAVKEALMYFNLEATILVFFAFFINLTVISCFASFPGQQLGLTTAGNALEGAFGTAGKYIWALGLICSGQSATLTGTLAGQYVMQGFVSIKVSKFVRSLITRSLAIIPSILVVLFVDDVTTVNEYINVSQVFILPLVVVPLLKVACNRTIMREYTLGNPLFYFLSMIAVLLTGMNVYLNTPKPKDGAWGPFIGYMVFFVIYLAVIVYITLQDLNTDFDKEEIRKEFDSVFDPVKMEEPNEYLEEEDLNVRNENDDESQNSKNSKNIDITNPLMKSGFSTDISFERKDTNHSRFSKKKVPNDDSAMCLVEEKNEESSASKKEEYQPPLDPLIESQKEQD